MGRSNIVGKPVANLMLQKRAGGNATVTLCHTRTKDMDFHTKRADILIVAAGVANMIKADQVKEGVVVIDVGVNRVGMTESGKAKSGWRRGLRFGEGEGRRHYPSARRRRADDHHHADEEHRSVGEAVRRAGVTD